MPRVSKIATGQRLIWLERFEAGESAVKIAQEFRRNERTVREQIERAKLERDFIAAQRDQLRQAIQSHQADMLGLLEHLRQAVQIARFDFRQSMGPDFGLEDVWGPSYVAQNPEVGIGPALPQPGSAGNSHELVPAVTVQRDANGPNEIRIRAEGIRLWRAVKEHIAKDAIWRHIATWKRSLLAECQGRTSLNQAIRRQAEQVFGAPVRLDSAPATPQLYPKTVDWIRTRLINQALGVYVPDVADEIKETSPGRLEFQSDTLTENVEQPLEKLRDTLDAVSGSDEVRVAAQNIRDLAEKTRRVQDVLDDFLLIHHIPGLCSLCRKLAGQ